MARVTAAENPLIVQGAEPRFDLTWPGRCPGASSRGGHASISRHDRLIRLPDGNFLNPAAVSAIRRTREQADRITGGVRASLAICCDGHWDCLHFTDAEDAGACAAVLADLVNWMAVGGAGNNGHRTNWLDLATRQPIVQHFQRRTPLACLPNGDWVNPRGTQVLRRNDPGRSKDSRVADATSGECGVAVTLRIRDAGCAGDSGYRCIFPAEEPADAFVAEWARLVNWLHTPEPPRLDHAAAREVIAQIAGEIHDGHSSP